MLYDSITFKEIVDADSAQEFMKEATKLAKTWELEDIGRKLEAKSAIISGILAEDKIDSLNEDDLKKVIGMIFTIRRKTKRILKANGLDNIRSSITDLLYGEKRLEDRFDEFVNSIESVEMKMRLNFAGELLHYSNPDKYWLWTNWIWDPDTKTGSLPLVIQDFSNLSGTSLGDTYLRVGKATLMVNAVGHKVSFSDMAKGLFGTNLFLACVYAVYMYTVFKVKLSQEFNRILPELAELTQRVLGVYQMELKN
ncbi:MAG: hypothetical protein IIB39_00045 [Candidatus Marinimicrobia bacterium]|nr:hypothetical protein [Candidatus Neomarinimicrobiota bacterium]